MNGNLQIHRYELFSRTGLNAQSDRRGHCGVLIRFDSGPGVGCIHPWPELGDDPLEGQLEKLRNGNSTPLIEQALRAANVDWLSELGSVSIPKSHFTCVDSESTDPASIFEKGFRTVKLKGDGNQLDFLKAEMLRWSDAGFRIRVDFNETGKSASELVEWWKSLEIRDRIEFLEDPVLWNSKEWRLLKDANIPLAADRGLEIPEKAAISDWWVVKPALVDTASLVEAARREGKDVIITSYMDHAIGQLRAAYWAGKCAIQVDCGLLTHELFEREPFFDAIETRGAYFKEGSAFAEKSQSLLESLDWEELKSRDCDASESGKR